MLQVLVVLVLTCSVGLGVARRDVDCAGDDCGMGGDDREAGDDDACPPFCGGCVRVATLVPLEVAPLPIARLAGRVTTVAPLAPAVAPTRTGLFRPPRG